MKTEQEIAERELQSRGRNRKIRKGRRNRKFRNEDRMNTEQK